MKSVLWRVAKCLSYIEEARYLKVKVHTEVCVCGLLTDGSNIFAYFLLEQKYIGIPLSVIQSLICAHIVTEIST